MPRPYIGPKLQAQVPEDDWAVVEDLKEAGMDQADAIRHIVSQGAQQVRFEMAVAARVAEAGARRR